MGSPFAFTRVKISNDFKRILETESAGLNSCGKRPCEDVPSAQRMLVTNIRGFKQGCGELARVTVDTRAHILLQEKGIKLTGYMKMGKGGEGPKGFRKAACGYHLNGGGCGWGVDGVGCGYSHPTFWEELEQCGDDKNGKVCSQGFSVLFGMETSVIGPSYNNRKDGYAHLASWAVHSRWQGKPFRA